MDIQIIRKAVCKNRGGLDFATDSQILKLWNSLDIQTQEFYLQSVGGFTKGKDIINATRNKPEGTV